MFSFTQRGNYSSFIFGRGDPLLYFKHTERGVPAVKTGFGGYGIHLDQNRPCRVQNVMAYYNKPFSLDLIAGFIRALVRIPTTVLFILISFFFYIPIHALVPSRAKGIYRNRFQRFLMGTLLWILGGRIKREGPRPEGQVFFVANHLGVADVFAVMAETGARLVAKDSLSRIPLFGFLMKRVGVIFIRRDSLSDMSRVVGEMTEAYRAGDSVAFFPEGTTSRGQGVRKLLGALFLPAVECGAPVYYGLISFYVPSPRWPLASVSVSQVGGSNFIAHLARLCFLPRFIVFINYSGEPVKASGRKALVAELEKRMVGEFQPMEQLPREELARLSPPVAEESRALKTRPFLKRPPSP